MITTFAFFRRRADLTPEAFGTHWQDVHGPLVAVLPYLRGYVQNHRYPAPAGPSGEGWDGVAGFWWDDREAAARPATDPAFTESGLRDEPNFLDPESLRSVVTEPFPVSGPSRPLPDPAVKVLLALRLRAGSVGPGLAGLAAAEAAAAGADRALLHVALPGQEPVADAVVEMWWRDPRGYARWSADPTPRSSLGGAPLVDAEASAAFVAREHTVIAPPDW